MYLKPELLISTDVPSLSQANSISCSEFYDYIVFWTDDQQWF